MCFPEKVTASTRDELVMWVGGGRTRERRSLRKHDEKDDACREEVDMFSFVRLTQMDLRGHVRMGAELSVQHAILLASRGQSCKTKISNLNVELLVEHDVLWL